MFTVFPMFTDSQELAGHKSGQLISHRSPKPGHSHTEWGNRGPVGGEGTRVITAAGPPLTPLCPRYSTLSLTLPQGAPTSAHTRGHLGNLQKCRCLGLLQRF